MPRADGITQAQQVLEGDRIHLHWREAKSAELSQGPKTSEEQPRRHQTHLVMLTGPTCYQKTFLMLLMLPGCLCHSSLTWLSLVLTNRSRT